MTQDIWLIDSFTAEPFKGNPAGVCLLKSFPVDSAMQQIAMELNQAETAFLVKMDATNYRLRWFTPAAEIKLCGHATLAATQRLLETNEIARGDSITYHTLSGELHAHTGADGIALDFPALPGKQVTPPAALRAGLTVPFSHCEFNGVNYLAEIADYATLLACAPIVHELIKLEGVGVGITTATGVPDGFDFASRYFAPNYGVDEDPVTGSMHCMLTPFWAERLGKNSLRALQASRRTGVLELRLEGERVFMKGQAVAVLKGTLLLPLAQSQHAA